MSAAWLGVNPKQSVVLVVGKSQRRRAGVGVSVLYLLKTVGMNSAKMGQQNPLELRFDFVDAERFYEIVEFHICLTGARI